MWYNVRCVERLSKSMIKKAEFMKLLMLLVVGLMVGQLSAEQAGMKGRVPFADPHVLYHQGMYYAYGTFCRDGIGVATSRDLEHWQFLVGKSKGGLALHKDDSFGDKSFWAPEVYRVGNKFIMYYSAEEHICAAVAESPLGPFRQAKQEALFPERGRIDNSLFRDREGRPWMIYVKFDRGNAIYACQLENDLLHVKPGTERFVLRATEPWELRNPQSHITEGPCVIYAKGHYILTYSANDYRHPDYAVGVAVAKRPEGPWVKCEGNPILCGRWGLKGTGHHTLFKDRRGAWRMAFHAHNADAPDHIHPRNMYIAELKIGGTEGAPKLSVGDKLVECRR